MMVEEKYSEVTEKEYIAMSLKERGKYSNSVASDKWFPAMWWVQITKVQGDIVKGPRKNINVDGFFVLRKDIKALYEAMGYLSQEILSKELSIDWFEERYGPEEVKQ